MARYVLGKTRELDLKDPRPEFDVQDSRKLREMILTLTLSEARKIRVGKSTLWSMRGRAQSRMPLRIYRKYEIGSTNYLLVKVDGVSRK